MSAIRAHPCLSVSGKMCAGLAALYCRALTAAYFCR
jgi:hypothetical protein